MGCTIQKEVRLEKASEPKNELFANGSGDEIEYIVDEGKGEGKRVTRQSTKQADAMIKTALCIERISVLEAFEIVSIV